jgi:DnaJ-class molecular chaperone
MRSVQVITAEPCPGCDGEGFVDVLIAEGETVRETCHECEGVGAPMVWMICQDCHGTAEIFVDEREAAELIDDGHTPLRTPST